MPTLRLSLIATIAFALTHLPCVRAADVTESAKIEAKQDQEAQASKKRKEISLDAISAVRVTQDALRALDANKPDDALAALEQATGKLSLILARDPKLAFAPVAVSASTQDILADLDAVQSLREAVEKALKDGKVQAARHLIRGLASETVVSVTSLPLATYPDAMKEAARLIDEGKIAEAKVVLQTALNTLVISETIIPLPVVTAQHLLEDAETLAKKTNRTNEENTELRELLESARTELKFAEALGYGTKQDFKDLFGQIDEIGKKTENGKSGTGFFDKIKEFLGNTVKSSQPEESTKKE